MSSFVMACWLAYSFYAWDVPNNRDIIRAGFNRRSKPIEACQEIERQTELAGRPRLKWLLGALAWHETMFIPDLVSKDGMDVGIVQSRVSILTGNPFLKKSTGHCTRAYVLTLPGGVECGILAFMHAEDWFQYKHDKDYNREKWLYDWASDEYRSPIGCYAEGMPCRNGEGAREIMWMQQQLLDLAHADKSICIH